MKKEIEVLSPDKLLPWIGAPFMSAWVLEGIVLIIGFTPDLLFVNYFFEAVFLFLFCLSCRKRYECYKNEPNLKITGYFTVELIIHVSFIVASVVQSALNVRTEVSDSGLIYRHEFLFISILILTLHALYMCIDYYVTEKAAIIRYCKRVKTENSQKMKGF